MTGRVLSHSANTVQYLRKEAAWKGWDHSELVIKTLHCNNPQFILFQIEAC